MQGFGAARIPAICTVKPYGCSARWYAIGDAAEAQPYLGFLEGLQWCEQQTFCKLVPRVQRQQPGGELSYCSFLLLLIVGYHRRSFGRASFGVHIPPSLTLLQSTASIEHPFIEVLRGTLHCCGRSVHDKCSGASEKPLHCISLIMRSIPIRWLHANFPAGHSQFPSIMSPC